MAWENLVSIPPPTPILNDYIADISSCTSIWSGHSAVWMFSCSTHSGQAIAVDKTRVHTTCKYFFLVLVWPQQLDQASWMLVLYVLHLMFLRCIPSLFLLFLPQIWQKPGFCPNLGNKKRNNNGIFHWLHLVCHFHVLRTSFLVWFKTCSWR